MKGRSEEAEALPNRHKQHLLGVDVGGTFTDMISVDSDGLHSLKFLTGADPSAAVAHALRGLGRSLDDVALISHATTLATNALLTRSGLARSVLVTNDGFRDVLEIGRQRRPELYSLSPRRPQPLIARRDRLTVKCRIGADGSVLEPLAATSARRLARYIVQMGFQSVAISFLNSYLDGFHEVQMREALAKAGFHGHVSISSEVDKEYREYERTSTTVVNAVLAPLVSGYLESLRSSLERAGIRAPVYIMTSDGATSTLSHASALPVSMIESGPAAGVVASKVLAKRLSMKKVLTFDMGGTTAKAGTVLNGEPDIVYEFEAAGKTHSGRSIKGSGYAVRGPFIDLAEVSAGGGTIAWLDEAGELRVGPRSAGSDPGPACYRRGGTEPTVTDANVALGRLNPRSLLGGSMIISRPLALRSLRSISQSLDVPVHEVARGVVTLVNDSMARALSLVSVERGRDPRDFTLFAFGGAGPVHACDLAEELDITDVVVPLHAGLFSAYGLLAGDLTRTFSSPVMKTNVPLRPLFDALERSSQQQMRAEGFQRFSLTRQVEARYLGQSHELLLPYKGDGSLRGTFDSRHRELYGYHSSDGLEVVSIKVRAKVLRRTVSPPADKTSRRSRPSSPRSAWVGGTRRPVEVLTRESLRPGERGSGPCIIEEDDSTLVVNPSWTWETKTYGTRLRR